MFFHSGVSQITPNCMHSLSLFAAPATGVYPAPCATHSSKPCLVLLVTDRMMRGVLKRLSMTRRAVLTNAERCGWSAEPRAPKANTTGLTGRCPRFACRRDRMRQKTWPMPHSASGPANKKVCQKSRSPEASFVSPLCSAKISRLSTALMFQRHHLARMCLMSSRNRSLSLKSHTRASNLLAHHAEPRFRTHAEPPLCITPNLFCLMPNLFGITSNLFCLTPNSLRIQMAAWLRKGVGFSLPHPSNTMLLVCRGLVRSVQLAASMRFPDSLLVTGLGKSATNRKSAARDQRTKAKPR